MHNLLRKPDLLDGLAHAHPRDRAVEVMPDQPPARRERVIRFAAVVQDMLQVMAAVDEDKLERRQPGKVIGHRIAHDEEGLVGRSEVIGEMRPVRSRGRIALLLGRTGRGASHPADQPDAVDASIRRRPPGHIRRHVPEGRANLQHTRRRRMTKYCQHGQGVVLAGIAAKRAGQIRIAKARQEFLAAHGENAGRRGSDGCHR